MSFKIKLIIVLLIILIILLCTIIKIKLTKKEHNNMIDGGVVKDRYLKGYNEKINSKDIIFFEYSSSDLYVLCEKKDDSLHIISKGENFSEKDNSYFKLDYTVDDISYLNILQKIVEDYNISKDNGHEHEVSGLPAGLGDYISVNYESNEKIWKYSNQHKTIKEDAIKAIYDAFHDFALKNNYDFTTDKSNVVIYDDATIEYLQGTWEGKHFGKKYKVIFKDNNVKIYEDDKLTDDTFYKVIKGKIVVDKLKDGISEGKDKNDYEEFSVISTFSKKNDFSLVAYFMKESYSTCELLKQK